VEKSGEHHGTDSNGRKDGSYIFGKITLEGQLVLPNEAQGIVIFAHGSGSSRFSPRNQFVAESLQSDGLATLLCDLLTREEEEIDTYTVVEAGRCFETVSSH